METLNAVTISEYESLKQMLLSTDDDKSIAFSNIKNLNLEPVYIVLLTKQCRLEHRKKMIEEFKDTFELDVLNDLSKSINTWAGNQTIIDLSWDNIYQLIKNHYAYDNIAKEIFETEFKKDWFNQVVKSTTWKFINDIDLQIKW
jgi:hypothetical protein